MKRLTVLVLAVGLLAPTGPGRAAETRRWGRTIPAPVLAQYQSRDTGRYIVLLRDRADLRAASALPGRDVRRRAIVEALRTTATRSQAGLLRLLATARAAGTVSEYRPFWLVNAIGVQSSRAVLQSIAGRPEVSSIVADAKRQLVPTTRSQLQGAITAANADWNIEKVGVPGVWALGIDGTGAVVSSIDTGVDLEHPSVASKYRGAGGTHDYNWWDAINHEPIPYDDNAHGTHTMGTMLGGDGEGPDPDDIGVAPGATWIAAKAFDDFGGGIDTWILEAAQFLTAPTRADGTEPQPELAPDVVNNSWGGGSCDPWFDDVLSTWRAMSIFPAFAIGNAGEFGEGSAGSPGDSPSAFSVGATDIDDEIAYFSSRGPSCYDEVKPEVSAPGVSVRSSVPGGGFEAFDGTSMATPHIAGTVALMVQAGAGAATIDDMENALAVTALDLGAPGADNTFGAGRLQALDAVQIVFNGGTLTGRVTDVAGAPVSGASILAEMTGGRSGRVRTAADGTYRLRIVDGTYQVTASAFGFLPRTLPALVIRDQTTTLDFALNLAPRVTVSGVIREGPAGTALNGATVTVLETPLAPATTGSNGKYSIIVPAGTYVFEAQRGHCLARTRATVIANSTLTQDFALARLLDSFGYVCDETAFVHEPGSQKLQFSGYDAVSKVTLPFAFPFYGRTWNDVWVHGNGFVTVLDNPTEYTNRGIPDAATPNGAIYALWDDAFVRGSARGVYTASFGSAPNRRFVIEYRNFEVSATGDLLNFAVVLRENGAFETRYRSLEGRGNGIAATVGIENLTGSSGIQYSLDERSLTDGMTIRYRVGSVGIVQGTVTSAADGLPVAGATVSAGGPIAKTAADGTYRLAAFPGTYTVQASAPGWDAVNQTVSLSSGSVRQRNFALPAPRAVTDPLSLSLEGRRDPVTSSITLRNPGQRALDYSVGERPAIVPLQAIIDDPDDDSLSSVEITGVLSAVDDGLATIEIAFSASTDLSEVVGYVHLDTDQNPDTGRPPTDLHGKPEQDIGYDYYLDMWGLPYGEVSVYTEDDDYVSTVPASVESSKAVFSLPLADLGGDDGAIDVTMVLGDYFEPTDWAPDSGHGSIPVLFDVDWLTVGPAGGSLASGGAQTLSITADPRAIPAGLHLAEIAIASNDPRTPVVVVPITFDVIDITPPRSGFDGPPANVAVVRAAGQAVTGASTDDASGIAEVLVTFTPLQGGAATAVPAQLTCDEAVRQCLWTAQPPGTGPYSVVATATDRVGNLESPGPTAVILSV